MKQLYAQAQISKQGHYQALLEEKKGQQLFHDGWKNQWLDSCWKSEKSTPPWAYGRWMSCINPPTWGGMPSSALAWPMAFGSNPSPMRPEPRSQALTAGMLICWSTRPDINQLWTSDLTYFRLGETFCYLVFILDVYSRRIVGYSLADNMRAENNLRALQMAFKTRKQDRYAHPLIHHSDRGGQYISQDYTHLLTEAQLLISMGNEVYENAHIERVNGTIKNQYLMHWNITNFEQLQTQLKRAVQTYNQQRPHSVLGGLTPLAFEHHIKACPDE